jgi:hypothetical protein
MSSDLEQRLRAARSSLTSPDAEAEERALAASLRALPRAAAGVRRPWLLRRPLALVAATAIAAAAVGAVAGAIAWPGPEGASAGVAYPGPFFEPAEGWTTVATGTAERSAGWAPLTWTTNVPVAGVVGAFGVFPLGGSQLRTLPPDGVLVVAWLPAPDLVPAPVDSKDTPYVPRELPLRLEDAEVRSVWEGQPSPQIPSWAIWARVKEQWLDVRIYFGRQQPTAEMRAAAADALERLHVPDPR